MALGHALLGAVADLDDALVDVVADEGDAAEDDGEEDEGDEFPGGVLAGWCSRSRGLGAHGILFAGARGFRDDVETARGRGLGRCEVVRFMPCMRVATQGGCRCQLSLRRPSVEGMRLAVAWDSRNDVANELTRTWNPPWLRW